jgi:predicted ATP-dependent serine protease
MNKTSIGEKTEEFVPMFRIEPKSPQWVIEDWIPRNGLTIMTGHPGTGKTWAALAMAAFVASQGGRVVIISTDDAPEILRNRLDTMGVDISKIGDNIFVSSKPSNLLLISSHEERWKKIGQKYRPDLVILDSLISFISAQIDINRANKVKEALSILDRAFPEAGVLAIFYKPKSGSKPILGSRAFMDKAKSVIEIEQDPLTGERTMKIIKSSYKNESLIRPISFRNHT